MVMMTTPRPGKATARGRVHVHVRVCVYILYIPLRAGELVELAAVGEDDERDLGVAEHGELVRLLEQAVAALGEGDLSVDLVLDPLELDPPPPHVRRRPAAAGPGRSLRLRRQIDRTSSLAPKQQQQESKAERKDLRRRRRRIDRERRTK